MLPAPCGFGIGQHKTLTANLRSTRPSHRTRRTGHPFIANASGFKSLGRLPDSRCNTDRLDGKNLARVPWCPPVEHRDGVGQHFRDGARGNLGWASPPRKLPMIATLPKAPFSVLLTFFLRTLHRHRNKNRVQSQRQNKNVELTWTRKRGPCTSSSMNTDVSTRQ